MELSGFWHEFLLIKVSKIWALEKKIMPQSNGLVASPHVASRSGSRFCTVRAQFSLMLLRGKYGRENWVQKVKTAHLAFSRSPTKLVWCVHPGSQSRLARRTIIHDYEPAQIEFLRRGLVPYIIWYYISTAPVFMQHGHFPRRRLFCACPSALPVLWPRRINQKAGVAPPSHHFPPCFTSQYWQKRCEGRRREVEKSCTLI